MCLVVEISTLPSTTLADDSSSCGDFFSFFFHERFFFYVSLSCLSIFVFVLFFPAKKRSTVRCRQISKMAEGLEQVISWRLLNYFIVYLRWHDVGHPVYASRQSPSDDCIISEVLMRRIALRLFSRQIFQYIYFFLKSCPSKKVKI